VLALRDQRNQVLPLREATIPLERKLLTGHAEHEADACNRSLPVLAKEGRDGLHSVLIVDAGFFAI